MCALATALKANDLPNSVHFSPTEILASTDTSILIRLGGKKARLKRDATAFEFFDELGGRLDLSDHKVSLIIPPGALAQGQRRKITFSLFLSDHSVWLDGKRAYLRLLTLSPCMAFRKFVSFQAPNVLDLNELSDARVSLFYLRSPLLLYNLVGELTSEARVAMFTHTVVGLSPDYVTYHTQSFCQHLNIARGSFKVAIQAFIRKDFVPAKGKTLTVHLVFSSPFPQVLERIKNRMARRNFEQRSDDQFSCNVDKHSSIEISLSDIEKDVWTPAEDDAVTISVDSLMSSAHSKSLMDDWITRNYLLKCNRSLEEDEVTLRCKCLQNNPSSEVNETPQTISVLLKNDYVERRFPGLLLSIKWMIGVALLSLGISLFLAIFEIEELPPKALLSIIFFVVIKLFDVFFTFTSFKLGRSSMDMKSRVSEQSLPTYNANPRFPGEDSFCQTVVPDSLRGEVNPVLIQVVANLLESEWERLVPFLTGNATNVRKYKTLTNDDFLRTMIVIEDWQLKRGPKATVDALIKACEKCGVHPETIAAAYEKEPSVEIP